VRLTVAAWVDEACPVLAADLQSVRSRASPAQVEQHGVGIIIDVDTRTSHPPMHARGLEHHAHGIDGLEMLPQHWVEFDMRFLAGVVCRWHTLVAQRVGPARN
jgi:hypothetical protein